jgi:hypothetical protein
MIFNLSVLRVEQSVCHVHWIRGSSDPVLLTTFLLASRDVMRGFHDLWRIVCAFRVLFVSKFVMSSK